jgi:hypothetical protein
MIFIEKFHFIFHRLVAMLSNERSKEPSNAVYPHEHVKRLALRRLLWGMVTGALP